MMDGEFLEEPLLLEEGKETVTNNAVKVFVVGNAKHYACWIDNSIQSSDIDDCHIVLFTGGSDVNPEMYNEPVGRHTAFVTERDWSEAHIFEMAVERNIPIIGICRGAQLACVLAGGRLVQHQLNPYYIHSIITDEDERYEITSTHHQAQYPYDMKSDEYKLIAWTEDISPYHLDGTDREITDKKFKEAEIVFYPKIRALGIQGHPEMLWSKKDFYDDLFIYLNGLIKKYLLCS